LLLGLIIASCSMDLINCSASSFAYEVFYMA
jgi:hypothetical protein